MEICVPAGHRQNIWHLCPRGHLGSMDSCGVGAHRALLQAHGKLGMCERRQMDGNGKCWHNWSWMNVPINPRHCKASFLPYISFPSKGTLICEFRWPSMDAYSCIIQFYEHLEAMKTEVIKLIENIKNILENIQL